MFIRARPAVAASFSWPYAVTLMRAASAYFDQQGDGATGRVVDRGAGGGDRIANADDLRHDAGDLGGSIELALALAAFGGEVAHEVFVGVAENVVALRAVLEKSRAGFSKMAITLLLWSRTGFLFSFRSPTATGLGPQDVETTAAKHYQHRDRRPNCQHL
jgi:hypothetical protein